MLLKADLGLVGPSEKIFARFDFAPKFKSVAQGLLTESSRIETLVKRLESDPQSDLNAAKSWLRNYESGWSSIHFERGSRQEFEALVRALLLWWGDFSPNATYLRGVQHIDVRQERLVLPLLGSRAHTNDELMAVKRVYELVNEHFVARRQLRAYALNGSPLKHEQLPSIRGDAPSMHERLEAGMLLREWLQDKATPGEIDSLLFTR